MKLSTSLFCRFSSYFRSHLSSSQVPLPASCLSPSSLYSASPPPFKDLFVTNVYTEVTHKATPSSSYFSTSFTELLSRHKLSNRDTSVGFNSFFCFLVPMKPILMIFNQLKTSYKYPLPVCLSIAGEQDFCLVPLTFYNVGNFSQVHEHKFQTIYEFLIKEKNLNAQPSLAYTTPKSLTVNTRPLGDTLLMSTRFSRG